jgi:low temperature requirement protein LtrA
VTSNWCGNPRNRSRRHSWTFRQFFVIALGELILVIGLTVSATGFTPDRAAAFAVSIATTVLFWRIYIYYAAELLPAAIATAPEPDRIARSALFAHLLMVAGIVATAVGSELVIDHPLGHTQPAWIAVTLGGPALFLAGRTTLEHQVSARMSWDRLIRISVLAAIADVTSARGRPLEPSPPPDRPS